MYNPVTNRTNFIHRLNYTLIRILNHCKNLSNCILMILHLNFFFDFIMSKLGMIYYRTFHTDSFNKTFAKKLLICHIKNLILKRGTSAVDYQNFHFSPPYFNKLHQYCLYKKLYSKIYSNSRITAFKLDV